MLLFEKDQNGSSMNAVLGEERIVGGDIVNRGLLGHTYLRLVMLG